MDSLASMNPFDWLADPEVSTFWNAEQAILWSLTRDLEVVRGLFNQHAMTEAELISLVAEPDIRHMWPSDPVIRDSLTANNMRMIKRAELPILTRVKDKLHQSVVELRLCCQAGDLQVSGRKKGKGEYVDIPPIAWTRLQLAHSLTVGQVVAIIGKGDDLPEYSDLQFRRNEVMRVFPAEVPNETAVVGHLGASPGADETEELCYPALKDEHLQKAGHANVRPSLEVPDFIDVPERLPDPDETNAEDEPSAMVDTRIGCEAGSKPQSINGRMPHKAWTEGGGDAFIRDMLTRFSDEQGGLMHGDKSKIKRMVLKEVIAVRDSELTPEAIKARIAKHVKEMGIQKVKTKVPKMLVIQPKDKN